MIIKFQVNALVVVSHEEDATIYRVKAIEGNNVGVIDAEMVTPKGFKQAIQWHDRTLFKGLNVEQMLRADAGLPS